MSGDGVGAAAGTAVGEVHCPACGAPVTWDPASRALACGSCGARTEVTTDPAGAARHTLEDASRRWPDRPRRPGTLRLACRECGAVVETGPGALTARCAFCGSDAVAEAPDDGHDFPVDAVVPFTVSREVAEAGYRRWLGRGWFRPAALSRRVQLESLVPVYVPFWAFDFDTHNEWACDVGPEGARHDRAGHPIEPVGDWRRLVGEFNHHPRGVLAAGSAALAEDHWRALAPFPVAGAAPYDPRFLAGFAAARAPTQPLAAWQSVRTATEAEERAAALERIPDAPRQRFSVKVSYRAVSFCQVLLPIWVAAYRDGDRTVRFLINGATGAVQGRAPVSRGRVAVVVVVVVAVLAAGLYSLRGDLAAFGRGVAHAVAHPSPPADAPRATPAEQARKAGVTQLQPVTEPVHLRHFPEPARRPGGKPPPTPPDPP